MVRISGVDSEHPDVVIARLATEQDGMVERTQLVDAGVTVDAIRHRLATRRLHTYFRGQPRCTESARGRLPTWT